tara:strand:+ start:163 stop:741 length:579 start_codon:yes stop_codon:yes gene_type:complete
MCAAIPALGLTSKLAGGLFLGSLGIGVVSTIQAQRVANQQASYAYESARRSALSADAAFAAQQEAISSRLEEERAAQSQKRLAASIKQIEAQGAIAATEGISGNLAALLDRDAQRQAATLRETINQTMESADRQYERDVEGLVAQRESRRNEAIDFQNQAYMEAQKAPTLLDTVAEAATLGLNSYIAFNRRG